MQEGRYLATIVIVNYNYAQFVAAAIDSALEQSYDPLEVIVVDDGSDDGSREVISSYGDRIRPLFQDNGGQGAAYNAGWRAARGLRVRSYRAPLIIISSAVTPKGPVSSLTWMTSGFHA